MKNNLKLIRERLGLTQPELADLLGVSQGNVSHCETQKQEVSPEMARRLIQVAKDRNADVTFDDIYSIDDIDQQAA